MFAGNQWTEATANWSNVRPHSMSTLLSYQTVSYEDGTEQPKAHTYAFDITAAVDGWRTGACDPEKGIIFAAQVGVEQDFIYVSKAFGSYNHWAYKPTLSVTYETRNNQFVEDAYYLNNGYWGEYLRYGDSTVYTSAGLISNLGNSIRWEIQLVNGGYAIRSQADPTKYLAVADWASNGVVIETVNNAVIPQECVWTITTVGGCLIKSKFNSKYLTADGAGVRAIPSTGAAGSDLYNMCIWRIASTSYYGNTSNSSHRELEYGFSIMPFVVNIGESAVPVINTVSANTLWARPSDFVFKCDSDSDSIVYFDYATASGLGEYCGISNYVATHKVTGQTVIFQVYVDRYLYELVTLYGFNADAAVLIRSVYDIIDYAYHDETEKYRAWVVSRLLSESYYEGITTVFNYFLEWDEMAGSVTSSTNRQEYYIDTLGYTAAQYDLINRAIKKQHTDATANSASDFAHMQFAIAARLAYVLNKEIFKGVALSAVLKDDFSYIGGWLGDATLAYGSSISLKNDDYMADLDAENVFRKINTGMTSIEAINVYYNELTPNHNRTDIFLSHIPYDEIKDKVFYGLIDAQLHALVSAATNQDDFLAVAYYHDLIDNEQYHWEMLSINYKDSYNFLLSLRDRLSNIASYS